jgi:hypothetical protein
MLSRALPRARRAHLRKRGWWHLGKLMVQPLAPREAVRLIQMHPRDEGWYSDRPCYEVLTHLHATAKSLLVGSFAVESAAQPVSLHGLGD